MSFNLKFGSSFREDKDESEKTNKKKSRNENCQTPIDTKIDNTSDSTFRQVDKDNNPPTRENSDDSKYSRIDWSKPYLAEHTPDKFDNIDWSKKAFKTHEPDKFDTINWNEAHGTIAEDTKEIPNAKLNIKTESLDEKTVREQEELLDSKRLKTEEKMAELYQRMGERPYYRGEPVKGFKEFQKQILPTEAFTRLIDRKDHGFEIQKNNFEEEHLNTLKNELLLKKPCLLVNHYFEKVKKCRTTSNSTKVRHNYHVIDKQTLYCPNCDKSLINKESNESKINLTKKELRDLDESKNFGDITIYRISINRSFADGALKWLKFPGINYVGQTVETARNRCFRGHIKKAFDPKKKHTYIEHSIKRNFQSKKLAHNFIKTEVIQIVRFKGDINEIREMSNQELKKKKLEEALELTQKAADKAERFWIGFYKTQFKEFGRNIDEGGRINKLVLLDPRKLHQEISNIMHIRRNQGPFKLLRKKLGTTRAILKNNLSIYYGKPLKEIKHDMLIKETKRLFKLGYLAEKIAKELKLEGQIENSTKTVSNWIRYEIYNDRFPDCPSYRRIRDAILSEIIIDKVKEGHKSYKSLLKDLPGFKVPGETFRQKSWELKRFVGKNLGGLKKLLKEYNEFYQKEYLKDAIKIIRELNKEKKEISATLLAEELGFSEKFGYKKSSLKKNASRYISKHLGKNIRELKEIARKNI
ncbi:MAG: hypothetical protein EU516_01800 [Promethearchaeota archaeon]|nr:MAG: hypothetical protein EU516_01800 [Candidatus Lokiarchaeota archaeon]